MKPYRNGYPEAVNGEPTDVPSNDWIENETTEVSRQEGHTASKSVAHSSLFHSTTRSQVHEEVVITGIYS